MRCLAVFNSNIHGRKKHKTGSKKWQKHKKSKRKNFHRIERTLENTGFSRVPLKENSNFDTMHPLKPKGVHLGYGGAKQMYKLVLLTQCLYITPKLRPIKRYEFRTIPPFFNNRILKTFFVYIGVINDYYLHVRS